MKLIETLKARYQRALRDARAQAQEEAHKAVGVWRAELLATVMADAGPRLDARTPFGMLARIAHHRTGLPPPSDPKPLVKALRKLYALTTPSERRVLADDVKTALWALKHYSPHRVTPGPVMRVLLSARLIYRAWRQDV